MLFSNMQRVFLALKIFVLLLACFTLIFVLKQEFQSDDNYITRDDARCEILKDSFKEALASNSEFGNFAKIKFDRDCNVTIRLKLSTNIKTFDREAAKELLKLEACADINDVNLPSTFDNVSYVLENSEGYLLPSIVLSRSDCASYSPPLGIEM